MTWLAKLSFFTAGACFLSAIDSVIDSDWLWALALIALALWNWRTGERA